MTTLPRLQANVLGPLELSVDGRQTHAGPPKLRLLLALFLSHPGVTLSADDLVDALWGEAPPRTARKNLQVHVSALRKLIGNRVEFTGWGYRLDVAEDELDLLLFERLARDGQRCLRSGERQRGADLLARAITLWRGQPFAEFEATLMIASAVGRITEAYLSAFEDWAEHEVQGHGRADALRDLDVLVARYPHRERLVGARMVCLALSGRSVEAVNQFMELRRYLTEELGIDPGTSLCTLYEEILNGRLAPEEHPAFDHGGREPVRNPPNHLPHDVVDFTGRHGELAALRRSSASITVISGDVGTGKSALAVHAAHGTRADFVAGVRVVELGRRAESPGGLDEIRRDALASIGVDVAPTTPDSALRSMWLESFPEARSLLILDDAPHEDAVRAMLPGTPATRVLVTSRRRLSGLESADHVSVGGLEPAEAERFLALILGPERTTPRHALIRRVLDRWGRAPLILRIIGQRVDGLPDAAFDAILERLATHDDVLDDFSAGDLSLRHILAERFAQPTWRLGRALSAIGRMDDPTCNGADLADLADSLSLAPDVLLESLIEENILHPVDAEVVGHEVLYTVSPLVHRYAGEVGTPVVARSRHRESATSSSTTLRSVEAG